MAASLFISTGATGPAFAVDQPPPTDVIKTQEERTARRVALDAITRDIEVTKDRQDALRAEMQKLDVDRESLNQTLLDTTARAKTLEKQIDDAEQRMSSLLDEEKGVHASLVARRGVLADVLGALQRMGRKPPPAIIVRPQDALASVRSAMLLGAVVPGLRDEAQKLAGDLQHLVALKTEKEQEHDRMRADASALAEEQTRIQILVEDKQKARLQSQQELASEQARSEELAKSATSLKDLIANLEGQLATSAAAAQAAKQAETANEAALNSGKASAHPTDLGAADRIAPAVAFAETKGLLPRPASGVELKSFGDADGLGGTTQGISIATRAASRVSSPSDGWVVYAGPFRSYGQLLIINGGGGYHILLAGMQRIDVSLGQFVLAGEPVAVMGSPLIASSGAVNVGATQPVLYVEFRKDGTSIDPDRWWARSNDEKVGG